MTIETQDLHSGLQLLVVNEVNVSDLLSTTRLKRTESL